MSSFDVNLYSSFRWLVVLLVIFGVSILTSHGSETECERKMSDTLDMLCSSYGVGSAKFKKSIEPMDNYNYVESDSQMPFSFEDYPLVSQFQQNKIRRKRYSRIANVCCKKPCSMGELLMFCKQY